MKGKATCGRRAEVKFIGPQCRILGEVIHGPFTVVWVRYTSPSGKTELDGWGLARCSALDTQSLDVGYALAYHRAVRAIVSKRHGRNPHHPYMG
jgi:hypothetical protein